jgi:hypothetical protein
MKLLRWILSLGSAAALSCVTTTGVTAPDQVMASSSFQACVTAVVNFGVTAGGYLGVLLPVGWVVDNVTYTGPYSGSMFYDERYIFNIEAAYPTTEPYQWTGYESDTTHTGEEGDVYEITLTISTDETTGQVDVAFLATSLYTDLLYWDGDPCSTLVEVTGLSLEKSSWGGIKSRFQQIR